MATGADVLPTLDTASRARSWRLHDLRHTLAVGLQLLSVHFAATAADERPVEGGADAAQAGEGIRVPVVATVAGVAITLYYNDHDPAHFHALLADDEMQVRISDLAVIEGSLPGAKRRRVLAWAARHQNALALAWIRCRDGEHPGRIPGEE